MSDTVKRMVQKIVTDMFEHLDVRAHIIHKGRFLDANDKWPFLGQGHKVEIHLEVPQDSSLPPTPIDSVTVERLERCEWRACEWMEMKIGDIVRFRGADGRLENGVGHKEGDREFLEVRDWIVTAMPEARKGFIPSSVRCDAHDYDLVSP